MRNTWVLILRVLAAWAVFAWLIWLETGSVIAPLFCLFGAMESIRADLASDLWRRACKRADEAFDLANHRMSAKTPGAGQP